MNVKSDIGIGEVLAKKLFSIETVPKEVQKKMVRTAIKTAQEYYEKSLNTIIEEIDTQIKIATKFKELNTKPYYDSSINSLQALKNKIERRELK